MKTALVTIAVLLGAVLLLVLLVGQMYRANRKTRQQLGEAYKEIAELKEAMRIEKNKQEVVNDEQRKAEQDKSKMHAGSGGDRFNAANDILRK